MGAGVHDVDRREAVALADVPVVEVVGGGDLDGAGAFLRVGVGVGDDGDGAADQRQADGLADEVGVAGVVGVDGDAGVAEHGLGAGGGDDEVVAVFPVGGAAVVVEGGRVAVGRAVLQRVAQAPEVALLLDLLDLEVGDGGLEVRVPVDQALAAVDQAAVVEVDEDLQDRVVKTLVHGEAVAREVEAVAEAAGLLEDGAAGLLLPLPDLGDEGLAAHLAAREVAGAGELALDDHLGGDAGVVEAGLPEDVVALHPVPAGEDVHQRVVEGVAHVQAAGDVGRRQQDGEGLGVRPRRWRRRGRRPAASQAALTAGSAVRASKVFSIGMGCAPLSAAALSAAAGGGKGAGWTPRRQPLVSVRPEPGRR